MLKSFVIQLLRTSGCPIDLQVWLRSYIRNRYGASTPDLEKARDIPRRTVYHGKLIRDGAESIITGRPTFDSSTVWTRTQLNYAPATCCRPGTFS